MTASPRDEIVELTCDLVAIPSVAERPDQLHAVIDYVERYYLSAHASARR